MKIQSANRAAHGPLAAENVSIVMHAFGLVRLQYGLMALD